MRVTGSVFALLRFSGGAARRPGLLGRKRAGLPRPNLLRTVRVSLRRPRCGGLHTPPVYRTLPVVGEGWDLPIYHASSGLGLLPVVGVAFSRAQAAIYAHPVGA